MALNPHQKNKVDISSLNEEELKLFRLYGKLPNRKDLLQNKLKERKYFDSGDYAMSKAGKSDAGLVGGLGREHPSPDTIPHLSQQTSSSSVPTTNNPGGAAGSSGSNSSGGSSNGGIPTLHPSHSSGASGSPVKEPSILARGMSVDEQGDDDEQGEAQEPEKTELEKRGEKSGVPIRSA